MEEPPSLGADAILDAIKEGAESKLKDSLKGTVLSTLFGADPTVEIMSELAEIAEKRDAILASMNNATNTILEGDQGKRCLPVRKGDD